MLTFGCDHDAIDLEGHQVGEGTLARCRTNASSPTCCTACITVMLSFIIGMTHSVRVDVTTLHLTGVVPMAQPLGHLSNYTTPADSTPPYGRRPGCRCC